VSLGEKSTLRNNPCGGTTPCIAGEDFANRAQEGGLVMHRSGTAY
jgi:hypothetical protein